MKIEQSEMLTTGLIVWSEAKTCLTCGVGGLRTEQRDSKLVLMQGTKEHKCRRKSKKN